MSDNQTDTMAVLENKIESKIENWRNVPGDVDDFIFCMQENPQSER